jgi:hypothetical protein
MRGRVSPLGRGAGFGLIVLVLLLVASCRPGEGNVTTEQAVASLEAARFSSVSVFSNVRVSRGLVVGQPAIDAEEAVNEDSIQSPAGRVLGAFATLVAVRSRSVAEARRIYSRGYSRNALRAQLREARRDPAFAGALLKGFDLTMISTARVCNVVLAKYNPSHNAPLDRRFADARRRLRNACH